MDENGGILYALLGNITFAAFPLTEALKHPSLSSIIGASAGVIAVVGAIILAALLTYFRVWRTLWTEWLTSLDHKRIGIMYVVVALVMFTRALIEAVLMRTQQSVAINDVGLVVPDHFAQLFSTHGSIMIFFMAMPFLTGLINFAMPLQIGSRDVAFPLMNNISLMLTGGGAILMMVSLVIGKFSTGGWSGYPPYTELAYSGGVGPDYWIWAVTMSSLGSMLTGLNFAVTIYKRRAPGMTWMRMPLFCWTSLCTSIMMVFAMPALTVATLLLAADRYLGMHFFTDDGGGNMMNYVNLFWLFGHPEVYILVLPGFGVYNEVISAFSSKELYGYTSLVIATMCIGVLSFTVWLHHFFTMGQGADVNAAFGIATMLIGIPTGVKIYDWVLTMFRGEVRYTPPMMFAIAFLVTFTLGGFTGMLLAQPPLDYQVHNTVFLVAHFHNVIIPGVLFAMIAGYQYWFPKAFGFRLKEGWGKISCLCFVVGFYLAFMPLYVLGVSGMARRTQELYDESYRPWLLVAEAGALIILAALISLFIQLYVSIRDRDANRVPVGDPWDARSLEWSTAAPAPEYNFATIPHVSRRDTFYWRKRSHGAYHPADHYRDIEIPRNSMTGVAIGVFGTACSFGLVWHIWWLAALSIVLVILTVIARGFVRDVERVIPAEEVERTDRRWLAQAAAAQEVPRQLEETTANQGLAQWMA